MATVNSNSSAGQATAPSNAEVAGAYIRAADTVSAVLNNLGVRSAPPTGVRRPAYPANLRELRLADVLKLRDEMLIYRSLLVDELCRCRGLEIPMKEQVDMLKAKLMKNSVETNADKRRAAVEVDNTYIKTNALYTEYKSVRVALDEQLSQIDNELERIRDECFYKQKQYAPPVVAPRAVPIQPAPAVTQAAESALRTSETQHTVATPTRAVPVLRPKPPAVR